MKSTTNGMESVPINAPLHVPRIKPKNIKIIIVPNTRFRNTLFIVLLISSLLS